MTVVSRGLATEDAERLVAEAKRALEGMKDSPPLEVVHGGDVAQRLTRAVATGELVVIGAPSTDPMAALVGETVPGVLAARSLSPVIMVRDISKQQPGRLIRFFLSKRN